MLTFDFIVPIIGLVFRDHNMYHLEERMLQAKFSVKESHARFLSKYKEYGFKDKSTMLRAAIDQLIRELELERLKQSADLYSEIYFEDDELKEITEEALEGWPE